MRAILFGTQVTNLQGVAACLDAAGVGYGVVTSRWTARSASLERALDIIGVPPASIALAGPAFLADLSDFARALNAEVVMATDLRALMHLATHPNLVTGCAVFPAASPDLLDRLHNKWRFHELTRAIGVPGPRTALLHHADDPAAGRVGFPAIIKPLAIGGGIGVHRIDGIDELRDRLSSWPAAQFPVLMQEYVPGTDIDISLLADKGRILAWTVQRWTDETTLVFEPDARALANAERIVAATGFTGVAHIDMREDARDGSLRVIECNPRFWGSVAASMAVGVNFPLLGAQLASGQQIAPPKPRVVRLTHDRPAAVSGFGPRGRLIDA